MDEERENGILSQHPLVTLYYPPNLSLQTIRKPTLNKITTYSQTNSLYCGYSDGKLLHYDTRNYQLSNVFSIYDNTDIIDLQLMGSNLLVTCTHNQVTLFDIIKDKSLSLKGHQQTPISVAAHPFSPLVTSISNLVLQHDLRVRKPINVNFITPPVYGVQYLSDGTYYFLSGEPCRVGRDTWVKTLLNGIGKPSENCKYVAVNDMSGSIVFWDWKRSKIMATICDVQNEDSYQPIYFAKKDGDIRGLVFLQDNGNLLEYDLLSKQIIQKKQILQKCSQQNWKFHVDDNYTTDKVYVYEHDLAIIKCFKSHEY